MRESALLSVVSQLSICDRQLEKVVLDMAENHIKSLFVVLWRFEMDRLRNALCVILCCESDVPSWP
jgi:hypothetical protein